MHNPLYPLFIEETEPVESEALDAVTELDELEETNRVFGVKDTKSIDALSLFLNKLSHYRLLTKEEEITYSKLAQEGDIDARNKMINHNLRLVVKIAKKYKAEGFEALDFIQEGILGLEHAIYKFDPTKGFKFSTYAIPWIMQSIGRVIEDKSRMIRLPAHMVQKVNRINKELTRHEKPSIEEVAKNLDMSVEDIKECLRFGEKVSSLDKVVGEDSTTLGGFVPDAEYNVEEIVEHQKWTEKITQILPILNAKQREVVIRRYGLCGEVPLTLSEVGDLMHLTRERIRQIEGRALEKIRNSLRWGKEQYFTIASK